MSCVSFITYFNNHFQMHLLCVPKIFLVLVAYFYSVFSFLISLTSCFLAIKLTNTITLNHWFLLIWQIFCIACCCRNSQCAQISLYLVYLISSILCFLPSPCKNTLNQESLPDTQISLGFSV